MVRSGLRSPAAIAVVAWCLTGCYFEGSVGYPPLVSQKAVTPRNPAIPTSMDKTVEGGGTGWSLGIKIGFYYDIMVRAAHTQIGLGLSPFAFNFDALAPFDELVRVAGQGTVLPTDVFIP